MISMLISLQACVLLSIIATSLFALSKTSNNVFYSLGVFWIAPIVLMFFFFDFSGGEMSMGNSMSFGYGLSIITLILSILCFLVLMQPNVISPRNLFWGGRGYFSSFSTLMVILYFLFFLKDFFKFFILFEVMVIPIVLIIFLGGSSKFRSEASFFLLLFTMMPSLLLLLSMISFSNEGLWLMLSISNMTGHLKFVSSITLLGMVMAFLSKFPIFFFHIWLPKAHVEAPVVGSMILAGILLKVGAFGFELIPIATLLSVEYLSLLCVLTLWGGIVAGMLCYNQKDKKILVAFSSVNHMSLCILGIFSLTGVGWVGCGFVLFGHGLMSSLMFFLLSVDYTKSSQRASSKSYVGGSKNSVMSILWILTIFFGSGFPPFLNFMGEMSILSLSLSSAFPLIFLFLMNFFMSGLYAIALLSHVVLKQKEMLESGATVEGGFIVMLVSALHLFFYFVLSNVNSFYL